MHYITIAKDNSKGGALTNSQLSYEVTSFVQATCLKMINRNEEASKAYFHLEDHFKRENAKDMMYLLFGSIVVPLSDQRKTVADHWIYLKEYLEHLSDAKLPKMEE